MATLRKLWVFDPGRRPSMLLAVSAVLVVGSIPGCVASPPNAEPPCGPPAYSVNPSSAKVGDQVTISAPDADCNPQYGQDAQIQVTISDSMSRQVINTTAPMNDAGGFSYRFDVPPQTAIGKAAVTALPYNLDPCDDTGKNNRANGTFGIGQELSWQRAACTVQIVPLDITP